MSGRREKYNEKVERSAGVEKEGYGLRGEKGRGGTETWSMRELEREEDKWEIRREQRKLREKGQQQAAGKG